MLLVICSRGGIGRRKGLKIRNAILKNIRFLGILRITALEKMETMSFVNHSNRHIFVALDLL